VKAISVIELGVTGGGGPLAMADLAASVQAETGMKIAVYGFDSGTGLRQSHGGLSRLARFGGGRAISRGRNCVSKKDNTYLDNHR
jgi:hypothetical protein